jgi:hypothetical protein
MMIVVGVGVLVQRAENDQTQVDYSMTGWSGDVMFDLHRAKGDEECEFLSLTSKPRSLGFLVWASNPTATVCWFGF